MHIIQTGVSRRTKRAFTVYLVTPWNTALLEKQSSSASQEIPRILWNSNVHYRIHKRPSLAPILGRIHPVHAQPSYFMKIHCNIVRPTTSRCGMWSLSFMFFHQNRLHISHFIRATCLDHLILDHTSTVHATKIIPPVPFNIAHLKPKYIHQHPILEHPQPLFLPQCERLSFTPI